MHDQPAYADRLPGMLERAGIDRLPDDQQRFIAAQARTLHLTQQELQQLADIAIDLNMWDEAPIETIWPETTTKGDSPKQRRQRIMQQLRQHHQTLRERPKHYDTDRPLDSYRPERIRRSMVEKTRLGLGWCPVASPRTRCCNLLTLDAVENCGFDCSYCSIQSFYHGDEVRFDSRFAEKLEQLEIDPDQTYHIGTGQSSDSLMWGNQAGILDALFAFARRHPNVILELKSKSKNINYLLKNDIPPNVLCTWSLNTPAVIANEEHLSAPLDDRLNAARRIADKGNLVGFHFHPMSYYDNWRKDYGDTFRHLTRMFDPDEVAMVSLGTLTFIKPVIKKLRGRPGFHSKILQMPMAEAGGKLSYPDEIKIEMFRHAYESLADWHDKVFFYLCMEHHRLWQPVFGFEYGNNDEFEQTMKTTYMTKINARKPSNPGHLDASLSNT